MELAHKRTPLRAKFVDQITRGEARQAESGATLRMNQVVVSAGHVSGGHEAAGGGSGEIRESGHATVRIAFIDQREDEGIRNASGYVVTPGGLVTWIFPKCHF